MFDEQRAARQLDPILGEFFGGTSSPSQDRIDWLVKRHGLPGKALGRDADGGGMVIGTAEIVFDGPMFDWPFEGEDQTSPTVSALVFVARDRFGDTLDLVAWAPRTGQVAARFGRASVVGEHEINQPRLDDPLPVHRTLLSWLKAGRAGVVIVDQAKAWRVLEGVTLLAEDVEHGLELRKQLTGPTPRIVVPSSTTRNAV